MAQKPSRLTKNQRNLQWPLKTKKLCPEMACRVVLYLTKGEKGLLWNVRTSLLTTNSYGTTSF